MDCAETMMIISFGITSSAEGCLLCMLSGVKY